MGILSNIFSKIFPASQAATRASVPALPVAKGPGSTSPVTVPEGRTEIPQGHAVITDIDVEQMLDDMAARAPEKLNWKTSIVDLMKLLGLDSSLTSRKVLAHELNYTGNLNDSASMNLWLHRQVMNKVAANGGRVPADLTD